MPKSTPKQWIQSAIRKGRKGALSRQLGIPTEDNIPVTLLKTIKHANIGEMVHNPTTKGKRWIKVTRLLKKRAVLNRYLRKSACWFFVSVFICPEGVKKTKKKMSIPKDYKVQEVLGVFDMYFHHEYIGTRPTREKAIGYIKTHKESQAKAKPKKKTRAKAKSQQGTLFWGL